MATSMPMPRYMPLSVSVTHICEAGSIAAQEPPSPLVDGFAYVEPLACPAGWTSTGSRPAVVFFDAHIDSFEEIAVPRRLAHLRAGWRRLRCHRRTRALWLRFHTQTVGVSLTDRSRSTTSRTAVEALMECSAAPTSLHTNALDEVLALPTAQAAEIALRTQQVLMSETGVVNVADPLGGSCIWRSSPTGSRREAEDLFAKIRKLGGEGPRCHRPDDLGHFARHRGWLVHRRDRRRRLHTFQRAIEDGRKHQVGVTVNTETLTEPLEILRISGEVEREQVQTLAGRRLARDEADVQSSLMGLRHAAGTSANLIPVLIDAARAEATLGEICGVLRDAWGEYREPARLLGMWPCLHCPAFLRSDQRGAAGRRRSRSPRRRPRSAGEGSRRR